MTVSWKSKWKQRIKAVIQMCKEEKIQPVAERIHTGKELEGKTALIAGGTSGIGLAIAETFLECGCQVIVAGSSQEKLDRVNAKWRDKIQTVRLDIREVNSLPDKIAIAASLADRGQIDILVNSAGVSSNLSYFDMTEAEFDKVMDINLKGTYFMCQTVAKHMVAHKVHGHILNVSSASSIRPAWSPYHLSKWGVRGLTVGLAGQLLPYGIIVNAIAPGPVATPLLGKGPDDSLYNPINPSGRYATPREIAELAAFMVGRTGDLIVGSSFFITGGGGTISMHR
ncbi:SDR family NAD(P)-dependent oxidoreductase [Selenomonas montiformis]|uniref:SDR family NAD(P)-dependent oxidoreductase n=1 Tax=Selenomonas montiformis TaxID=2652285 RepID=UPI003F8C023B